MHAIHTFPNMFPLEMPEKIDEYNGNHCYSRNSYNICYSDRLFRGTDGKIITGVTQKQASDILSKEGFHHSSASEVVEIIRKRGYKDRAFEDYFGRSDDESFWELTSTRLMKNPKLAERYTDGYMQYCRDVYEGEEKIGELWIPEGGGRVVGDISVLGLPVTTKSSEPKYQGQFDVRFFFGASLDEAAVHIGGEKEEDGHVYIIISALWPHDAVRKNLGFRPIGGNRAHYIRVR